MSFSEFSQNDYDVIAREYADLLESARKRCGDEGELEVVQKAFDFANEAHKNVRRRSGDPYILHPIAVAKIVVNDIGLGYKSIAAAILHDVVEDTDYTVDDIRKLFGDRIAILVEGLTKIKTVLDNEDKTKKNDFSVRSLQAENFKRILLTLNDDVRVILIKLADRLHNCRTIEFMPEHKRDKILSETMFIFIPLAHRLGLYGVKSEMENIWLKYKEPDAYDEISRNINRNVTDNEKEIDSFIGPIRKALADAGFDFEIRKRVKTPYSIWHKMQTKRIPFEQVYDLYAIRIIFNPSASEGEREQCYKIFSIITGIYRYKTDRVRDWVKNPKSNGYEALHCTLLSEKGIWIEVQIRTRRMDDIAEKGIAAHWLYKQNGYTEEDNGTDKWLAKVKEILVNPDVNALELLDIIHNDLISSEILVFTPKGEQRQIQKGATALDFAYLIHTEIGNKAIAAKVNMKLVPLSYQLKSGDQVQIITAEDEKPKREWLSFLQTRKARNVVTDYFRTFREPILESGKEKLEAQLESIGYRLDADTRKRLLTLYDLNSAEELYFRIGLGIEKPPLQECLRSLPEKGRSIWDRMTSFLGKDKEVKKDDTFVIGSGDGRRYVTAPCCNPIPGDAVVGILSRDGGTVTVHKKSCGEAERLASKFGDRVVVPEWDAGVDDKSFLVRISIKGIDRIGLLNDISRYISLVMGVNMKKLTLGSNEGIFEGYIDMFVNSREVLDKMIRKLSAIDGIQSVARIDI